MRAGIAVSIALAVSVALTTTCSTKKTPTASAGGSVADHTRLLFF